MNPRQRPHRILVCDDEASARRGIIRALGRDRFSFVECATGVECLGALKRGAVDLVLLDLRMPDMDGRTTLDRIAEMPQSPPVVMVTADSQLRTAIEAVRAGATDFLAKPFEIDELRWVVERALEHRRLRQENRRLEDEVQRLGGLDDLLGSSSGMEALREMIDTVAPNRASVLVLGETGTGKELVAKGIHARSEVRAGPFVPLNCAAVPESLLESELFGHRKGAFTGADRDRSGRFREAHGGTLFLDEIGDMPAAAQAKLLRVLQEQTIEPLGGGEAVKVDVRMVAATHKDLALLCRQGKFREDLYYRLRVVEVTVPPLRERGQDVLLLARAFLDRVGKPGIELTSAVESKLLAHTWPGNVRELKNAMERAAIFCSGNQVQVEDLPAELRSDSSPLPSAHGSITSAEPSTRPERDSSEDHVTEPSFTAARERVVEQFETRYFTDLLRLHRGNVSRVAREAGLHRQSLQKMLRRLEIEPQSYRSPST